MSDPATPAGANPSRVAAGIKAAATMRARRAALAAQLVGAVPPADAPVIPTPEPLAPTPIPAPPLAVAPPVVEEVSVGGITEAQAREALRRLERELNREFPERREVIRGCILTLLARQHALLLGPPGTAKSLLITTLSEALGLSVFEKLMTAGTDPSEIFGPVDVAALREGRRHTVTDGMAPTAEVIILDEIFKSNSAILNALLALLNERKFHNGSRVERCPLVSAFAASNEGPADETLAALYDRLMLRFWVDYLASEENFLRVWRAGKPKVSRLARGVIEAAQAGVLGVHVSEDTEQAVLRMRANLKQEGIIVSDRRWMTAKTLVQASAWLDEEATALPEHAAFLSDVCWSEPEQRPTVKRIVASFCQTHLASAQELLLAAQEGIEQIRRYESYDRGLVLSQGAVVATKFSESLGRLDSMIAAASKRHRPQIEAIKADLVSLQTELSRIVAKGKAQ